MIRIAKIAFGVALLCAMSVSAHAEILIATVGPLKGQYAAFGEQLRQGVSRAMADVNATGGVNGEQLVLEVADDGCDPKQAMTVANQLVAKGVRFVAGHYCSGSSIAAAKIYEDAGIIMISPSSTSPKFTDDGGWNVNRVCGRDDAQGAFAGRGVAKAYAGKNIAILDDSSIYGVGLATMFKGALNGAGVTEKVRESYKAGANDYNDLVQKMLAANVDLIYLGGYAFEAGTIIRQMRDFASSAVLVGGDALLVEQFWATSGTSGEGTLVTFAPDAQKLNSARAVVEAFRAADYNPEGYTLQAYAAVQAFAQAATATRSVDGRILSQWLRAGNTLNTVLGSLSLDAKGDVKDASFAWYKWSEGTYAEAQPFPAVSTP
ncbi:MAG TPA: branched-chain amino acid ABC transporter substrate-binding protein [Aestuariivirga sp.]|nr:branched-chain amino acid ABC transporter substrate-binding protein [Aestuariivirga sp.]